VTIQQKEIPVGFPLPPCLTDPSVDVHPPVVRSLLWESLSGREHLLFYGRLKNLRGKVLQDAVERSLRSVNLYSGGVGDKRAGQYSGGMKRRLSVAISLIGDPLVV
jgi:ABC-type multidrug transport system ATPase subunit